MAPGTDVAPARVYPVTSTISCTVPKDPLNSWIQPSAPNLTMTVFATVCPAWKFRFEVPGMPTPDGHTVRYPPPCGPVTVTVATTAAAPLPGIPPRPATCTATVPKPATAPGICRPSRESAIRAGVTDTTAPASRRRQHCCDIRRGL